MLNPSGSNTVDASAIANHAGEALHNGHGNHLGPVFPDRDPVTGFWGDSIPPFDDSDEGPAVFYGLSGAQPGDEVEVERADGSQSTFVVTGVMVVRKEACPSRAVFGRAGRAAIRLVTCTGPFDPGAGYADSVIVWGHAVPA